MELHTAKIEQIATQLLAEMLANPEIYRLYPRVNKIKIHRLDPTVKKFGRRQQEELILIAIAMAETLVTKVENHDYFHSPTEPIKKLIANS